MIKNILLAMGLAGVLSVSAFAQSEGQFDIGVKAGGGNYTAINLDNRGFGNVGVEGCAFCSGHFGLFGEYTHWFSDGTSKAKAITSAELGAFGVRFQGGQRVRPFFDLGVAVGEDTFPRTSCVCSTTITGTDSHSVGGIVLGGGVTIAVKKHFYIRPQVRVYPMYQHAAMTAQVGFGWRF